MKKNIDNKDDIEQITIILASGKHSGKEFTIDKVSVKFEVLGKAFIIRKQFPICLS